MDRHDGARARIFLPRHLGGMGIVHNAGMVSVKGQLISRLALTEFLGQFYPNELTNLQLQHNFWLDIQLGQEEDLGHLTDIPASTIAAMSFRSSKAILALGKRTADTAAHAIVLTALADNGQPQTAANLLSYSASNFSFCFSTTGIDNPHYFRCAVRAKLGVGPTSEALEPIRHCPCTIVYNTGLKPFHALSCRLNGATWTRDTTASSRPSQHSSATPNRARLPSKPSSGTPPPGARYAPTSHGPN